MGSYANDFVIDEIKKIKSNTNVYDVGKVFKVQEYIIWVRGLENVGYFEEIEIDNKAIGYVNAILQDCVAVVILKQTAPIIVGDIVSSTGMPLHALYAEDAIGRITNIFGEDKLTGKKFESLVKVNIKTPNLPIMRRGTVKRPLLTGIAGIDLIYPIGRGQRQLIIGDKKTGKTQLCLDIIANQKDKGMLCIYVAIAKTQKELKTIYYELAKHEALKYTLIIAALNTDTSPVLEVTPYAALSIAERYMLSGKDVLVVIDDLKRHAEIHREISLMVGKSPGREVYPADIFYTHSSLLEKGCQHINKGSITILPIVETIADDISDYVSTNIISITDGQIVLSTKNFQKGYKPAINYPLSVSRLGGAVQTEDLRKFGSNVRQKLLSYLEKKEIYDLANQDEMSEELKTSLAVGQKILDSLMQYKYSPVSPQQMQEIFSFIKEENNE